MTVFYNTRDYDRYHSCGFDSANANVFNFGKYSEELRTAYIEKMKFVVTIKDNIICTDIHDNWFCLRCPEFYKGCLSCDGKNRSSYKVFIFDTFYDLLQISFTKKELDEIIPKELQNNNIDFTEICRLAYHLYSNRLIDIMYNHHEGYEIKPLDLLYSDMTLFMNSAYLVSKFNNHKQDNWNTTYYGNLPIEIMCNIAEYFSSNDLINMRTLCKYYNMWMAKEIEKRMNSDNIAVILSHEKSLYLYYGTCIQNSIIEL